MNGAYCGHVRTRYAPTPSGFLHIGNAANFVATHLLAVEYGAQILLRIDDMDSDRFRTEYLEDIFEVLRWLDLPWDLGPSSSVDMTTWCQSTRAERYRAALAALVDEGHAYLCSCSRSQWHSYHGEGCPGDCRNEKRRFEVTRTAWRLHYPAGPDPVVWRRDDLPAYHLTSVVDDDMWHVDLVVRGADLIDATNLQRYLSSLLPGSSFHAATVGHHALVTDDQGRKLSKSAGTQPSGLARTDDNKMRILEWAAAFVTEISRDLPRSFGR